MATQKQFRRRMMWMIIILVIVLGLALAAKIGEKMLFQHIFKGRTPTAIAYVSAEPAKSETWQKSLSAVGTLAPVHSVAISPEVAGKVASISFQSGSLVKQGQLLLQQDDSMDRQDLASQQAQFLYARTQYHRLKQASTAAGVSKDELDKAKSNMQQSDANVKKLQEQINKKRIVAPFDGKIGLRKVNVGQYLAPGGVIAHLVSWNPLYVQFSLPEQQMTSVSVGDLVSVKLDAYPNKTFQGKIKAIDSEVDAQTHTVAIQALLPNPKQLLFPGSYVTVKVKLPTNFKGVTVPLTAITASLYGNIIYVVKPGGVSPRDKKPYKTVEQRIVSTGMQQDNRIAVTKGLRAGEQVVTVGQQKLQNNSKIRINNK